MLGWAVATWAGAVAGLLATVHGRGPFLTSVLVMLGLTVVVVTAARPRPAASAAVLLVAAGAAAASLRAGPLVGGALPEAARDGAVVTAVVVLRGDPVALDGRVHGSNRGPDRVVAVAEVTSWRRLGVDHADALPLRVAWEAGHEVDRAAPGTVLRVLGRLGSDDPLRRSAAYLSAWQVEVLASAPPWQRAAQTVRDSLRTSAQSVGGDAGALLPGLVLGDTSAVPPELTQAMRDAGLAHLTAVSGGNVALTLATLWWLGRRIGLRRRGLLVTAAVTLPSYVVLVRFEPSVLRAAVMAAVGLLALAAGRRPYGPASICAAVIVLVLLDPFLAVSLGFALSVLATAALVLAARRWPGRGRGVRVALREAALAAAAAGAATAPLLAAIGGGVSLLTVPANMAALPAVAVAGVLGMLAALVGVVVPSAGVLLAYLAALPAGWIAGIARWVSALPGAVLPWPEGWRGALTLATVLALGGAAGWVAVRAGRTLLVGTTALVLVAGVVVAPAVGIRMPFAGWPPAGWVAVACDVGQGDALVLAAGGSSAVVVDAGPDPRKVDRCLRRLGIRDVPILLLTHEHADHVEGLPGVLHGRHVGEIVVSPSAEPVGESSRVRGWADAARIPVRTAVAGERTAVGTVEWTVLWPERAVVGTDADANNSSLVLLVRGGGISVLLTGDVEPEAQGPLLRTHPPGRVDVVKVPHHGSAHQDPALVQQTSPAVALISCGVDNDYGHPARATVQAYESVGAAVGRTDTMGDLAVVADDRGDAVLVARGAA